MAYQGGHLTDDEIQQFVWNQFVDPDENTDAAGHMDYCSDCRDRLAVEARRFVYGTGPNDLKPTGAADDLNGREDRTFYTGPEHDDSEESE